MNTMRQAIDVKPSAWAQAPQHTFSLSSDSLTGREMALEGRGMVVSAMANNLLYQCQ